MAVLKETIEKAIETEARLTIIYNGKTRNIMPVEMVASAAGNQIVKALQYSNADDDTGEYRSFSLSGLELLS